MNQRRGRRKLTLRNSLVAIAASICLLALLGLILWFVVPRGNEPALLKYVSTVAGLMGELGEPYGIAVKGSDIYVSDGLNGKIWKLSNGSPTTFVEGLDTPSAIAFYKENLIIADSGDHTIKSVSEAGIITTVAGIKGRGSYHEVRDTEIADATPLNGPIGLAVDPDGQIFIADTYNDRIRVLKDGLIFTLAGGAKGFADGNGKDAKFDTPSGIAIWNDKLLVADTGNRRIRVVERDGRVWTLAGSGDGDLRDGSLLSASFVQPYGITVDQIGSIFVTDGNSIRMMGGSIPTVLTISDEGRGLRDGLRSTARFNRPSSIAFDSNGSLMIADSENRLIRKISAEPGHSVTAEEIDSLRDKPEQFRAAAPARWPYDPPSTKRDIAGTLGEVRGEVNGEHNSVWFHNGLDIAGNYGETARFVRDEKVLRPIAAENFATLRELIRMPTLGYIHVRLGRNEASVPFGDDRFLFEKDSLGKINGVRIPRGTKFKAGEPIGTLNSMNHVHLVAGRSGSELNALDALSLPGISDSRPPMIEKLSIYDQNWNSVETQSPDARIKLRGNTRIVVKAYDQVDGNSERRRLGVYKLGYQLLDAANNPIGEMKWTIKFDRMPPNEAVKFVYADKSHSGATGETIFNYIVTNFVDGNDFRERFLNVSTLNAGNQKMRVFAVDYFGNSSSKDIEFEVIK